MYILIVCLKISLLDSTDELFFDIKNLKLAIFKVLSLLRIKNQTYYRLYMETFFGFAVWINWLLLLLYLLSIWNNMIAKLTYFSPMFHFHTPWKCQKTFGSLMLAGSIKMEDWAKMGKELPSALAGSVDTEVIILTEDSL